MQSTNTLQVGKGFILKFKLGILPACPKLHSALFKIQQQTEAIEKQESQLSEMLETQDSMSSEIDQSVSIKKRHYDTQGNL